MNDSSSVADSLQPGDAGEYRRSYAVRVSNGETILSDLTCKDAGAASDLLNRLGKPTGREFEILAPGFDGAPLSTAASRNRKREAVAQAKRDREFLANYERHAALGHVSKVDRERYERLTASV